MAIAKSLLHCSSQGDFPLRALKSVLPLPCALLLSPSAATLTPPTSRPSRLAESRGPHAARAFAKVVSEKTPASAAAEQGWSCFIEPGLPRRRVHLLTRHLQQARLRRQSRRSSSSATGLLAGLRSTRLVTRPALSCAGHQADEPPAGRPRARRELRAQDVEPQPDGRSLGRVRSLEQTTRFDT